MEPFVSLNAKLAPLNRVNVDTDQIIPKQFLKRVERNGFGQFMFYNWRYKKEGVPNPEFILNLPSYSGCSIIATRRNFGSGSSREHAVWALSDFGIKCIIAPSFADIFYNNCFQNGMLPIVLSEANIKNLMEKAEGDYEGYEATIDLQNCTISDGQGLTIPFETDDFRRDCLLKGLDDIGLTLQNEDKISIYEKSH